MEITRRKHPLTTKPIKNLFINSEPKNTSSENEGDRREQSENEVVEITRRKHPLTTKPIKNLFINSEPKNTSSTSKHKTIQTKPDNTKIPAATTLKSKVPRKTREIPVQVDKNKLNKKRERSSDEKSNKNGGDRDEPSSQDSVVIPRNGVKFKRLEFGGKKIVLITSIIIIIVVVVIIYVLLLFMYYYYLCIIIIIIIFNNG